MAKRRSKGSKRRYRRKSGGDGLGGLMGLGGDPDVVNAKLALAVAKRKAADNAARRRLDQKMMLINAHGASLANLGRFLHV